MDKKKRWTPGSWRHEPNAPHYPGARWMVWGPEGPGYGLVAHTSPHGPPVYREKQEETEANARLIAAAPDMYEALDTVHSWLVCAAVSSAEDMAQSFEEMERKAVAALEKARGREDT